MTMGMVCFIIGVNKVYIGTYFIPEEQLVEAQSCCNTCREKYFFQNMFNIVKNILVETKDNKKHAWIHL